MELCLKHKRFKNWLFKDDHYFTRRSRFTKVDYKKLETDYHLQ